MSKGNFAIQSHFKNGHYLYFRGVWKDINLLVNESLATLLRTKDG